jgi:hypothetical protein
MRVKERSLRRAHSIAVVEAHLAAYARPKGRGEAIHIDAERPAADRIRTRWRRWRRMNAEAGPSRHG